MTSGVIYVLINPAMPGLSKVGKTTRSSELRAAELSSTSGVPSPFIIAFQQPVADCDFAELWVHTELEREGHRLAENREFFNAPLHLIVGVVSQAANLTAPERNDGSAHDHANASTDAVELPDQLYELGLAYLDGTDTILANGNRALKHFEQAAAIGHGHACSMAASLRRWGIHGVRQDIEKALPLFKQAVALGVWTDLALIAGIFLERNQAEAAKKYWQQFFSIAAEDAISAAQDNHHYRNSSFPMYGTWYCEAVAACELDHCIDDTLITCLADELVGGIDKAVAKARSEEDLAYSKFKQERLAAARAFVEQRIVLAR